MSKLAASLAAAIFVLVLSTPATAGAAPDRVVITGPVVVPKGETVGDVVVIDGPVTIAGRVAGDVVAVSGPLRIAGTVDGDVNAVSDRATMLPGARVGGDLFYGDEKPRIAPGAEVAGKVSDEGWADAADAPWGLIGALTLWLAVSISALALGLVLIALVPRAADAATRVAHEQLGRVIGWGALLFFGLPIVAVIALVTLVGIPLGIGVLLALVPLGAIGYVTACYIVGRRIVSDSRSRFVAFLVGLGILRALALIPFLGILVWVAATVLGLGALIVAMWRARGAAQAATTGPLMPASP